jgi:hypothetical protein
MIFDTTPVTPQDLIAHYKEADWWEVCGMSRWCLAMYAAYGRGYVMGCCPDRVPNLYITDPNFFPEIDAQALQDYNPQREFLLVRPNPDVDENYVEQPVWASLSYRLNRIKFDVADATPILTIVPIDNQIHPMLLLTAEE